MAVIETVCLWAIPATEGYSRSAVGNQSRSALSDRPETLRIPRDADGIGEGAASDLRTVLLRLARAFTDGYLPGHSIGLPATSVVGGERSVAHDVKFSPLSTFGGKPAQILKKGIAARWIADVSGVGNALDAWPDM